MKNHIADYCRTIVNVVSIEFKSRPTGNTETILTKKGLGESK
jgi:hypothetical protein